jgi:8-oxo-dGTP pyrophosphatase MutT (NUDIX family)
MISHGRAARAERAMMTKQLVVAAIIERSGRFLLGKRSLSKQSAPGFWHAICGRMEVGESERAAVEREVLEETGLLVRAIEQVWQADTRDGIARINWWRVETLDGRPAELLQDEHSEMRWVTAREMRDLEPVFAEDVELFARLNVSNV